MKSLVQRGLLALGLALCAAGALAQAPATLTVAAAASLTDALRDLGKQFAAHHPQATLRFNFAASGVLLRQLEQGAPVDLFISADPDTMDSGMAQHLLDPATRQDFASNSVVLVVPSGSRLPIQALADLARPEVQRIALGKVATVPAGRYARQSLKQAGLWAALEPRFIPALNVRQVLDYVARGEVDAGFVYRTDALLMPDQVRVVLTLSGHTPVRYPMARVSNGPQPALAQAFMAFLLGPVGQGTLARYGFGRP